MDDFDVAKEDSEGRILLDPSVWANPFKTPEPQIPTSHDSYGFYRNPDAFLRQHFPNPFSTPSSQQQESMHQQRAQQSQIQQLQQQQMQLQQQHLQKQQQIQQLQQQQQQHQQINMLENMQSSMVSEKIR